MKNIAYLSHLCHILSMKTIAHNRRASYDYSLQDRYEAGIVLSGGEVRSVKTGHASLRNAFITIHGGELYLTNCLIPRYAHAGTNVPHEDTRSRKLLLKKRDIASLIGKSRTEGLTLVPIRLYSKRRLVKLEFAVAKGKKEYDRRADIGKREAKRRIERAMKQY